ncbi:MAG: F0F1 ATP synthase subunit B [bacterium]|nr:F0F1 ATP synthase subunit B [bacterium]
MEKLGFQLPILLAQIVNFALLVVVLRKLLYGPILKALTERRKKIEEGLAFARHAKEEEETLARRKEEVLKDAREEGKLILERAKKDAKALRDEILAGGKEEVLKLKEKAEKELTVRFEKQSEEAVSHAVDIAANLVRKLLPDILTTEKQHTLIIHELKKLETHHDQPKHG